MKAVLKKIKEHDLEMQQHKSNIFVHQKDPDVVMEKKMLEERKAQLKHSMETLKTFIGAAEKQDSNQKKLQMFNGDVEKEKLFYANLKVTKDKFNRAYFNITKQKEKMLFNSKLNKLVTLVRKEDKQEKVDELVAEIDRELIQQAEDVRDKLREARKKTNSSLSEELQKIYEDIAVKESLEASRPLIRRNLNLLNANGGLQELGLTPDLLRKISVGDAG